MLWILVNKVKSKTCVFKHFHSKWKADSGRDDKNVKIVTNEEDNDTIQFYSSSKSLPKIRSTNGMTTTSRKGTAADPMIIRTQIRTARYLTTINKFSWG